MKFGNFRKALLNSRGSILVQSMVSLAVLSSIVFGVMTYTGSSASQSRITNAQAEISSVAQIMSALAAEPELCSTRINMRSNFVRPANVTTDTAVEQDLAVNIGLRTNQRPSWVNQVMQGGNPTSVPGVLRDFEPEVAQVTIKDARLKQSLGGGAEIWSGDLVMYGRVPASGSRPEVGGKRIVAKIEIQINAAGEKVSCRTSTSVASICRDLGGVYDPAGVPNCLFALPDMSCGADPNAYIHDIQNGQPVCGNAANNCTAPGGMPGNFYAIGVTNGVLDCRRLSRRVVAAASPPPPQCTGGASTGGAGGAAPPTGCFCPAGESWNGGTSRCEGAAVACNAGSLYLWNGLNWDDYGSPNWTMATIGYSSVTPPSSLPPVGSNLGSGVIRSFDRTVECGAAAGPACTGGASTSNTGPAASPAGCYCPVGQTWNTGTSTCQAGGAGGGCYWNVGFGARQVGNQGCPQWGLMPQNAAPDPIHCSSEAHSGRYVTCNYNDIDQDYECRCPSLCPPGTSPAVGNNYADVPPYCTCDTFGDVWNGSACVPGPRWRLRFGPGGMSACGVMVSHAQAQAGNQPCATAGLSCFFGPPNTGSYAECVN